MAVPDLDTLLRTIDPASDGQRVARRMRSSMQSWVRFLEAYGDVGTRRALDASRAAHAAMTSSARISPIERFWI
jgi:hypothetical protein